MSILSRLAISRACGLARTLKPMISAPDALASVTSASLMPPTPLQHDAVATFSVAEPRDRARDRLDRALHVGLDQHRQLLGGALADALQHLLQRAAATGDAGKLGLPVATDAEVGDLARARLALHDMELVARLRRAVEAQDLDRERRPRRLHLLAAIVDQATHAAPLRAGDEDVADLQRAALDQHGRDRAAARIELGLDHDAVGGAVGIGLEVEQLGLQQDRFLELVEVRSSWSPRPRSTALRRPFPRPGSRRAAAPCARGSDWRPACPSC